ncbi:CAF17-like 4Fe-4S cluster assembly/insertion protein YgfZ [Tomitella biformata]|uniref:CAF17-like 4Fe-4S cluster assembly/insertion protein YgfZ n=1 Tax=Tomitella biformata TaxID=630403 RepID=UPI000683FD7F|nr:folate-binding protein YgfZ [Tomitella biformata]
MPSAPSASAAPPSEYHSPLLSEPGAIPLPPGAIDEGVAWHYGDPFIEQRAAASALAVVDRSHRAVIRIAGDDRLTWLHSLTSQDLAQLPDGASAESLLLDVNGRIEEHFVLSDRDGASWLDTEASHGASLLGYLTKMVFWSKVEPVGTDELALLSLLGPDLDSPALAALITVPTEDYATAPLPDGGFVRRMPWPGGGSLDLLVPRAQLVSWWRTLASIAKPAGIWAYEALRVESLRPRLSVDTDERTIPHEVSWIGGPADGGAVHLDKGCYRGQETVARVHNLGKPPRHLVLIHLDGTADGRPETGDDVTAAGRTVGRVGTVVEHHMLGPVALALVRRALTADTELTAGPCAASIDPDSMPKHDEFQAGRAAVDRLRGR